MRRRWVMADSSNGIEQFRAQGDGAGIHPIVSMILANRGITTMEEARRFLSPSVEQFPSPFLLSGMEEAVDRIVSAISRREPVLIFGDYDVDGITATSLLYLTLKSFDAQVDYFIPVRLEDGYGLSSVAVTKVIARRPSLVITVDCGITSVEGVRRLKEAGIDVVVTDHHEPAGELPDAAAVINPILRGSAYPFTELAGVGVAMKLSTALAERMGRSQPELFDLVALGTIADVMPLRGENRVYAKMGLDQMSQDTRPGIAALKKVAGCSGKPVGAGIVGFQLAPRINAAGRLGRGDIGVRLLTTTSKEEAEKIASFLDDQNKKRQEIEEGILQEARNEVLAKRYDEGNAIVLASSRWHQGVIGIVASRLVEEFYRPTVLISLENGMGKGSARSIPAFHLFDGLSCCRALLEEMGGHKYAAGLRIREDNIGEFRRRLNAEAGSMLNGDDFIPTVKIDAALEAKDVSEELMEALQLLTPYGVANPEPVFCFTHARVGTPRVVGKNHLKLSLLHNTGSFEAIGFRMGEMARPLSTAGKNMVAAAFTLQENVWNGRKSIQLNLRDIQPKSEG